MRRNGNQRIQIKTLHGTFVFAEQRLVLSDGTKSRYLLHTGQETVSVGLQEFCLYFCNRLSFQEVAHLVQRLTGQALVCEQTLWNWAQNKAVEIEAPLTAEVTAAQTLPFPAVMPRVDLYDPRGEEGLVLTDGICVKAQKPTRDKPGAARTDKAVKRHTTDVMLVQRAGGDFVYLCGSTAPSVSLPQVADACLRREWGARQAPLPVVAITDGARSIRQDLAALFASGVTILLDWYHLSKRVYEHLSRCAHSRAERETWEQGVLGFLWQGQVKESLSFLAGLPARNAPALLELVGYLEKHASEIIDYGRRQAIGKPMGSGRMEKAVDQVVGMRQKKKGMSWTHKGSRALALLKIVERNGQWQRLWNGHV